MPKVPGELYRQTVTYSKTGKSWTLIYAKVDGAGARIVIDSPQDQVFVAFHFDEQEFLEKITPDIPSGS